MSGRIPAVFRYSSADGKVKTKKELLEIAKMGNALLVAEDVPLVGVRCSDGVDRDIQENIVRLSVQKQQKGAGGILGSPVIVATVLCNARIEFMASAMKLQPSKIGNELLAGYMVVVTHRNSAGEETIKNIVLSTEQRSGKAFKIALTQQTGITGLFSHLEDKDVEALFANDTDSMTSKSRMYIGAHIGLVAVPGSPLPEIYWAVSPGTFFRLTGERAHPDDVILLTTEQMESILPGPNCPASLMFYPPPGSWPFSPPAQAKLHLTALVDELLPKLYGEAWPAAAAVLSIAVVPFLKVQLAVGNAVNVPIFHVYGGPGVGKTTFLELISSMNGRPDSSIVQKITPAQLYKRLRVINGNLMIVDDNVWSDLKMAIQWIHSFFNQRARSTTLSTEETINAVLVIVDNLPAMGITNLATLQRMVTYKFPALANKDYLPELLNFKATSKTFLPGLLNIVSEAGDKCLIKFNKHQRELRKLHDMNRVVYVCSYAITAVDILCEPLLSPEKHSELMAYMYGPFVTDHSNLLAQADLKPHIFKDIGVWARHKVAAGDGIVMPAIAADGARLLVRDGREGLWLVYGDFMGRITQAPLSLKPSYSKNQVLDLIKEEGLGLPSLQMRTAITLTNGNKQEHRKSGMVLFLGAMPSDLQAVIRAALDDAAAAAAAGGGGDGDADESEGDREGEGDADTAGASRSRSSSNNSAARRMSKLRALLAKEAAPADTDAAAAAARDASRMRLLAAQAAAAAASASRFEREGQQLAAAAAAAAAAEDALYETGDPVAMQQRAMQDFYVNLLDETATVRQDLIRGAGAELTVFPGGSDELLDRAVRNTVNGRIAVADQQQVAMQEEASLAAIESAQGGQAAA